ncbi:hypothetical protein EDD37DRAFT_305791 [Exophiala viscosa]|uniref:uncharacterized protein n=1 Tax=Exophiala viscosa TaxID=2486360 RepID=UPI00219FCA98|nr:hypothetical protein EDD37DRAFT_305791 [Exophiala viscosa]
MLNGDFETGFSIDEGSEATLRIRHDGNPNRTKITAQDLGNTSFAVKLSHVQYGTYSGQEAVLLRFNFEFTFQDGGLKRFQSAAIRLKLEETQDASLSDPSPRLPKNDPKIVVIAPVQIYGEVKKESRTRSWELSVPIQYNNRGAQAGLEASYTSTTQVEVDHRMQIHGSTTSDDEHDDDNIAVWRTIENKAQESGILHQFPAAVVAVLPAEHERPVKLTALVQPSIIFSLNPLRLVQKKDDAVFLDRRTPKGKPFGHGLDFDNPAFPWGDVVNIPKEYHLTS